MIGAILVVLAVLAGGGAYAVSRLIEPEDVRDRVIRQVEDATGGEITVHGPVELDILPWPTIAMASASIVGGLAAGEAGPLELDRLELRIEPLALLGGEVNVDAMTLVRPVLHLRHPAAELPILPLLRPGDDRAGSSPAGRLALSRLSIVDGTAIIDGAAEHRLEAVNLDVEMESERGPFRALGGFVVGGHVIQIEARIGRISGDAATTVQLEIDADGPSEPVALSFRGLAFDANASRLRGQLSVAGGDLIAGARAIAAALGRQPPKMPGRLAQPYEVSGTLAADQDRIEVGDLRAALGQAQAEGRLELTRGATPALDLDLNVARLEVPDRLPQVEGFLAGLAALPPWLAGEIDLTLGQIAYRDDVIRRGRLTLGLGGDGDVAIRQARATLPGNADLDFTGRLAEADGTRKLRGSLVLVSERLRALLRWLELDPPEVPSDRLQSFSLTSVLELDPKRLRLSDAEIRIDASQIRGAMALDLEGTPRLAATIEADRLNLDSYWPDATPSAALGLAQASLEQVDLALEAEVERLVWRQQRWSEIALAARSIGGRLELRRAEAVSLADTRTEISGEVDLAARRFDLEGSIRMPRPALLLTRLGFEPPLALARLAPSTLRGHATGWRDDLDLDLELEAGEAEVGVHGAVSWPEADSPSFQLEVAAAHPDYGALLNHLAIAGRGGAQTGQGPLQLNGRLRGRLDQEIALVGTATLGPTRVTGQVARQDRGPRPRFEVRLSLNDPRLADLLPPLALAGLRLDPAVLAGPILGNWPRQPIPLERLREIDASIDVTGKGGLAGDGMEVTARLEDRRLRVERFATDAFGGEVEIEASLHLDRPNPLLGLALELRRVQPAELAAWLDVPAVLEGRLDLSSETTAVGRSPFELMRSLQGYAMVEAGEGRLLGLEPDAAAIAPPPSDGVDWPPTAPLSELAGRFEIRRGIARTEGLTLDLQEADGEIEGAIDLLLWAADLELTLAPDGDARAPLRLEIVGPLDGPQVVRPDAGPRPQGTSAPPSTPGASP